MLFCGPQPEPIRIPLDLNSQSEVINSTEMIRASRFGKDAKEGGCLKYLHEDCRTLYDCFKKGAKESNNGRCLGWRENKDKPYQWLHYNETLLRAKNFGCGLVHLGAVPGSRVGIYSQNCPEWFLAELGLYCYSIVIVPLYDTLGVDACSYIISQAEISTVICDDDVKAGSLLERPPPSLKRLIHLPAQLSPTTNSRAKRIGVELIRFEEIESLGSSVGHSHRTRPPLPQDNAVVCYASATVGDPKGVILTHENIVAAVASVALQLGEHRPGLGDTMMSYLPMAHMLERCTQVCLYMQGGSIGFFCGDHKGLMEDMRVLRPTVLPTVPRLLNRIHDKMMASVNRGSWLRRSLFRMGMKSKLGELGRGILRRNSVWDALIFRGVQEGMGGRLRLLIVGSAPLRGAVLTFIRCSLSCVVVEGYGQTECAGPATLTIQGDATPEHVGPPLACCKMKLVDVPEMNYYASSGQGEVCIQGSNVFQGYLKDPERTQTVIDPQGWLHTGDVGTWLPNGTLKIIDRKKHIFKLSQGEYIAPEKIEHIYSQSQYVSQVFVYGESLKSCVVAIIVPDVEAVKRWAISQGIPGTLSVLSANEQIKSLILSDITRLGKQARLKSFEQAKDIYLHPDAFSVQNGLLTPARKAKRDVLKAYFKPQLDDMYEKLK